jgi:predicted metal-binding membrane protein
MVRAYGRSMTVAVVDRLMAREPLGWRHPEWWAMALAVLAWVVIVVQSIAMAGGVGGWILHHAHAPTVPGSHQAGAASWAFATLNWSLMVVAMMVPLVRHQIRSTATRSLWPRRDRAMAGFLLGYVSPWLVAGAAISLVAVGLRLDHWLTWPVGAAIGFAIAAAWQLTPVKWRALRSCHRAMPIAPAGWRADRDCFRYGWTVGGDCFVSCWALMVGCVFAQHSLVAMACVGLFSFAERYRARPNRRLSSCVLAGVALLCLSLALA